MPAALDPADGAVFLVQQPELLLVAQGPQGLDATVAEQPPGDPRIVEDLWRVDDPATEPVLAALAAYAPKPLSKAARKALFKRGAR